MHRISEPNIATTLLHDFRDHDIWQHIGQTISLMRFQDYTKKAKAESTVWTYRRVGLHLLNLHAGNYLKLKALELASEKVDAKAVQIVCVALCVGVCSIAWKYMWFASAASAFQFNNAGVCLPQP